jgi:chemotaxis protein MotB
MSANRKGHHGGAWKVAYADFVTAMMALFLVLWLTSQDQRIREAVQRAFRNPFSSITKDSTGIIPSKESQAVKSHEGNFDSASAIELAMLRRLNEDLMKAIQNNPDLESSDTVKLDLIPDGMRISIFDRGRKPTFEANSPKLTPYGSWVLSTLAWQIERYPSFLVELEGHTERGHPQAREDYGDWELTADRALVARRKLVQHGVQADQIREVHGFADTLPMANTAPEDETNRRVAVLLRVKLKKQQR